jgi:hypothetical protein
MYIAGANKSTKGGSSLLVLVAFLSLPLMVTNLQAQFSVRGGNQTISVTTAVAGSEPTPVVNTSSSLRYSAQANITRITVQTTCPNQNYTLTVVATGVTRGVAAPAVTLIDGAPASNLITNIPKAWGGNATVTLQYTCTALFSQGSGSDVHTVKYTLIAP